MSKLVAIYGGSGFVGRNIARRMAKEGWRVRVATRRPNEATFVRPYGTVGQVEPVFCNIRDDASVESVMQGADAVVNCVGILNESGNGGKGFQKVHVDLVKGIITACQKTGVSRLLHVSALNAGKGSSHYLKSKGEAELLLQSAKNLNVSIFQPSVIFGRDDEFFNRFAGLMSFNPVLPLACPRARLQPVYAGDVAKVMADALEDPMTWGKTYEIAGPKSYTLKELVVWTAKCKGWKRLVIGLPGPVSAMMAAAMNMVPGKPFSWDNYQSLKTDNTSDKNDFAYFGVLPLSIDLVVPDYLNGSLHQRRLSAFRRQYRR